MSPPIATSPIEAPAAVSAGAAAARARARGGMLRLPLDPLLTLAVFGLAVGSLLTLRAATRNLVPGHPHYYVDRQAAYLFVGFVLMAVVSRVNYSVLRHARHAIYGLLMFCILAVLALGHSAKGAQRAISLPLFSFQGSELGKVLLILALAALLVERMRQIRSAKTTALVLAAALVPALLVVVQPDLGSGLVYVAIAFVLLFLAGLPRRQLAALVAIVLAGATLVLVAAPVAGVHVLKSYQTERLTAFLHPTSNLQEIKQQEAKTKEPDPAYQLLESKIAIGSGQKTGRGAAATQTRFHFVPEDQTDFVFAAVGEQFGFVGAALVLSLYALLIWRALRILTMSRDLFGSLVAGGVVAMLMFQVFVNVGMSVGIMPITGVTLPLMSYGGSSVITTLLAVGLLQAIYVRAGAAQAQKGRAIRW